MAELGEAAERVLSAIIRLTDRAGGRSPTWDELAAEAKRSVAAVQFQVGVLTQLGYVHKAPGSRGFHVLRNLDGSLRRPIENASDTIRLPILGFAAAGKPIEAVDSDPETFPVPSEWCRGTCYLLRIRGDSMSGDGIQNGDLVLVEATNQVQAGAIHVCWLPGDGATIKRVRTKADVTKLVASNENFIPVEAPRGTIVQGRVVWVFRSLGVK